MLSSTLLIPALRPFFVATHPGHEEGMFLFMSVNMLGAIVGAPLLTMIADAMGKRALVLIVAAVVDGAFLFLCSLSLDLSLVLVLRTVQGAANVAAVSLLMGLTTPRGVPVAGGATIAAIAVGAPLGAVLLRFGPEVPLQVGAMLPLVVAAAIGALMPTGAALVRRRRLRPSDVWPMVPAGIFVFAERLAIGLFIVPFSLLAHDVFGYGDAVVGRLYAAFLVPFAFATALWPRLGLTPVRSVVAGTAAYAASLALSPRIDGLGPLVAVLVVGGVGAASIYAPALRSVAGLVQKSRVASAMGLVNALGALGMFLGSAGAGLITAAAAAAGHDRAGSLTMSFDVGAAALVVLCAAGAPLLARGLRAQRDAPAHDDDDDLDDLDDDALDIEGDSAAGTR